MQKTKGVWLKFELKFDSQGHSEENEILHFAENYNYKSFHLKN